MTNMTKRMTALAAATVALFAIPANAFWGDRVYSIDIDEAYEPIYVSSFAATGAPTAIYGTTSDGASAEAMAAAMRLPAFFSPRQISAGPTGERSGPHLVLVFNPSGATDKKACRGEVRGGAPGPDMKVLGVFCSSFNRPVSSAILETDGAPAANNPAFAKAMSQLLRRIVPPSNPVQGAGLFRRS